MYAVVDIESTGSPVSTNGIMELAIVLYNGTEIEGKYETLINPEVEIPPYVVRLTSITNKMVLEAPFFKDVAEQIYNLLKGRVFVAHNVEFDYNYIKYFLALHGFILEEKRLCTFKLSKKAFPNLPKHGLGSLTKELDIHLDNHHRAGGDAMATTLILDLIVKHGGSRLIESMIEK
ncbi:PolC-type DNA polymerase III [Haoranjiania flava]|uniref:3'-5' exonuclease n=1 Tax=Haoranjiania flava TaxID=1856322 RepID=A0AAE3IIZ9_9BACT|nr:3'-5' exonuclease [Haoranjiania flava]MCU7692962.1 3'-5' exonuclease [Haoranjiania flava]